MFVIRDLKIIEGAKGFFVAMPSRKLTDRCGHCGTKNRSGAASATSAAAGSTRTGRSATPTAGPSSTPTSPTRSTRCAARRSRAPCSPPTPTSSNARSSRATSRGTTTSTAASSTPPTRPDPRRPPSPPATSRRPCVEACPRSHPARSGRDARPPHHPSQGELARRRRLRPPGHHARLRWRTLILARPIPSLSRPARRPHRAPLLFLSLNQGTMM